MKENEAETPGRPVSGWRAARRGFLHLLTGVFFLLLSVHAVHGGQPLTESEKQEIYAQGTEYFHQAAAAGEAGPAAARDLYTKALLRFVRLVEDGGIRNGRLFYNIGNIHFLLDDLGRAILNYRRAEQFIPNDPNLAKNLAYARSLRQDRFTVKDQEKVLQTLFFFHYDLGSRTRLVLFAAFYASFWVFAVIRIFSHRPFTRWGLGITLLFTLLFGSSLLAEQRQASANPAGVILDPEILARQGDAESYLPSFADPLHAGTEFSLLGKRGAWWQIELPDGRSCWIPGKSAEMVGKKGH